MKEPYAPLPLAVFENRRLEPAHLLTTCGVVDRTLVDVRHPGEIAGNVHVRLGDAPLESHTRRMRLSEEIQQRGASEPHAVVVGIEVGCGDLLEAARIVRAKCGEHLLDGQQDVMLGGCARSAGQLGACCVGQLRESERAHEARTDSRYLRRCHGASVPNASGM